MGVAVPPAGIAPVGYANLPAGVIGYLANRGSGPGVEGGPGPSGTNVGGGVGIGAVGTPGSPPPVFPHQAPSPAPPPSPAYTPPPFTVPVPVAPPSTARGTALIAYGTALNAYAAQLSNYAGLTGNTALGAQAQQIATGAQQIYNLGVQTNVPPSSPAPPPPPEAPSPPPGFPGPQPVPPVPGVIPVVTPVVPLGQIPASFAGPFNPQLGRVVPEIAFVEEVGPIVEDQFGFPRGYTTRIPFTYPGKPGFSFQPQPGTPYFPTPPPSYLAYRQAQEEPSRPFINPMQTGFNPVPLAPLVSQKYCPDCDAQHVNLRAQREAVRRDLEKERSQLREKAISSQQQEIERLEEQERLPVEYQRSQDITESIREKSAMLQRIDEELRDLENQRAEQAGITTSVSQRSLQQPSNIPPPSPAGLAPLVETEQERRQLKSGCPPGTHLAPDGEDCVTDQKPARQLPQTQPQTAQPVIFCVGCETQHDAFRFFNGEPSKCALIPDNNYHGDE